MTEVPPRCALDPTQWAKLPLELRQRWWKETDYGRVAPSDELVAAIKEAAEKPVPSKK